MPCFRGVAGKGGRWVEGAHCIIGSCLIPLVTICGCDGCMGSIRGIESTGVVQIHSGLAPSGMVAVVWICSPRISVPEGAHRPALFGCEVRHEVTNAAVGDVAAMVPDTLLGRGATEAMDVLFRVAPLRAAIPPKVRPTNLNAYRRPVGASIHNCIAHKTVGAVAGRKAGHEAASCTCGGACRGATSCGGEGGACAVGAAVAKPGDEPGGPPSPCPLTLPV